MKEIPDDPDLQQVKVRLRQVRNARELSQREATERAGISQSVLEKYECRDNTRWPSTRQLLRLAEIYGVTLDFLLLRTDVPNCDCSTDSAVPPERAGRLT